MAATPLRADARRNHAAILEAAAAVFAEQGLDAGVAEIARRAEVGPATLFRHFPTKDDLVVAILEQRGKEILSLADEALERSETDPLDGLEHLLRQGTELHVRDRGMLQSAVIEMDVLDRVQELHHQIYDLVAELLRRCQEAGVVRDDLAPQDLPMAMAAAAGACAKFRDDAPGVEQRVLQLLLDGMRARDAEPLRVGPPALPWVRPEPADGAARRARSARRPKAARASAR